MSEIDTIRWGLKWAGDMTKAAAKDLRDKPLLQPTPGAQNGGNHAAWTMGHLCVVEGAMRHVVLGEPSPVQAWWPTFEPGSQPRPDGRGYPPFDELLDAFVKLREGTFTMLEAIGAAGLSSPLKNPPAVFDNFITTNAQTFHFIALHNMSHFGQLADLRRVAGLKPMM